MKRMFKITFLLLNMYILVSAQQMDRQGLEGRRNPYGRELFVYQTYNFKNPENERLSFLECNFEVVHDVLTFVKLPNEKYRSRLELSAVLYSDKKEIVAYASSRDTAIVETFTETNARTSPIRRKLNLSAAPGKYELVLQLLDLESKKPIERKNNVTLIDFGSDRIHMSDLVFADKLQCSDENERSYIPNLRAIFDNERSDITVYFEIYTPSQVDSVDLDYKVFDGQGGVVMKHSQRIQTEPIIQECLSLRDKVEKPGEYFFWANVKSGNQKATMRYRFRINWGHLTFKGSNIEMAIEQLKLVAKNDIIKKMLNADPEEREQLFNRFWDERDPTPDTPENELKKEFFHRIDFAERNFTEPISGTEGWRTDRGRVYIRNGPPDEVEKSPTEMNQPSAEIWYYARLNQRYIFSDRNGSGQYRLVKIE